MRSRGGPFSWLLTLSCNTMGAALRSVEHRVLLFISEFCGLEINFKNISIGLLGADFTLDCALFSGSWAA